MNDLIVPTGSPAPPEGWTRCHAYLPQKKRFCRQQPFLHRPTPENNLSSAFPGGRYCGNHRHLGSSNTSTIEATKQSVQIDSQHRVRIPCPVDPSHMIYSDRVEQHKPICPANKKRKTQENQFYFHRDINREGFGSLSTATTTTTTTTGQVPWERQKRLALRVLKVHHQLFGNPEKKLTDLDCIQLSTQDIARPPGIPLQDFSQFEFEAGLGNAVAKHRIRSGGKKHLHQQASLLGHIRRCLDRKPSEYLRDDAEASSRKFAVTNSANVTKEAEKSQAKSSTISSKPPSEVSTTTILELGAGRGMTGLITAGVLAARSTVLSSLSLQHSNPVTQLILVERAGPSRSKADTILRRAAVADNHETPRTNEAGAERGYMDLSRVQWKRIECDLAHIDMKTIVQPLCSTATNNNKLVVIAKHLCGSGVDLALKALEPVNKQLSVCIMATCCHGLCNWNDYVGRDYLLKILEDEDNGKDGANDEPMFNAADFDLLCRWSSGTVRNVANVERQNEISEDNTIKYANAEHSITYRKSDDKTSLLNVVESLHLNAGPEGLGRACQRLIDYGRLQFMRNVLFPSKFSDPTLVYYVAEEITPQNAALIASDS